MFKKPGVRIGCPRDMGNASVDLTRFGGHLPSEGGNALLRYLLGQAGQAAIKRDADLKRLYYAVLHRRGRSRAKVAVARKLLVRLYIMLRDEVDYRTFLDRAPAMRRKEMSATP